MKMQSAFKIQLPSWLAPAMLMLLGAALRLIYLGSVPGGMHQDETFVAWNSYALLHESMDSAGHIMPVYIADWGDGHSALYCWLLMPLLAIFNNGSVTAFLSRLPQALTSICTLWAIYCVIKRMFGRKEGLISLFLLAICPWHIMMSRWGLDANLAPGFLIFGFYFFIRGLEQEKYLLLSGLFYGLCLYSYAVIWPTVPVILLLQIVYGLYHKKLHINRWSILASFILFVSAVPLLLFILVNSEIIPEIQLPFISIPVMGGYRIGDVAFNFSEMKDNLYAALYLLVYQDTGASHEIILPYGLFYDIGRVFIVIGAFCLLWKVFRNLFKKEFCYEYFLFVQLVGGGIVCLMVTAGLHRINALYIPLVLCEAYGMWTVLQYIASKRVALAHVFTVAVTAIYLLCLIGFQHEYYTDYKELVNSYYAIGVEDCVDYALQQCEEQNLSTITVEKGAQWPRLLLYTETLPSQYLSSVEYDVAPAPKSFSTAENIRINTRIDYENISTESIYIIYYTDVAIFETDFTLTQFYDWYVAVPKGAVTDQP